MNRTGARGRFGTLVFGRLPISHPSDATQPQGRLSLVAAVSVAVGMVIGAGIFKSPTAVAENVPSFAWLLGVWALGGVISLAGGLCYAELSAAFPHAGGDYHFLRLAYGRTVGFLFAWSRFLVVNTGSLAFLGFVLGDYLQAIWPLGPQGAAIYAALSVVLFSGINLNRLQAGVDAQTWLTSALLLGLGLVVVAGLLASGTAPDSALAAPHQLDLGQALVFVLLAYGGWNEVTTLSADLRAGPKAMLPVLIISLSLIALFYLLVNAALALGLGLQGLAAAEAPAHAVVQRGLGSLGEGVILAIVFAAIVTSINATVIAGSRTTFAAAADWPSLHWLAGFDRSAGVARAAVLAQTAVALVLIVFGALNGRGFRALVDYTAPVYWLFLALGGLAVPVLRWRQKAAVRPFRTPFYPFAPLLFVGASLYILYSSVAYVRVGALAGLVVLGLGLGAAVLLKMREGLFSEQE